MIVEGIVTTLSPSGTVNISPMGPIVDDPLRRLILRPFRTSTTYQNLKRAGEGVFHITDDVELFAQAAVGQPHPLPRMIAAGAVQGMILADACRWHAFRIVEFDDTQERTHIVAEVVDSGRQRDFFGFNRAKHAVIEAAIIATRTHLIPPAEIHAELARIRPPVEKTGGEAERRAFAFLESYIQKALASN